MFGFTNAKLCKAKRSNSIGGAAIHVSQFISASSDRRPQNSDPSTWLRRISASPLGAFIGLTTGQRAMI